MRDLVRRLAQRVSELLEPENLKTDHYYKEKIAQRLTKGKDPWLHFDEILRCHTINDFGIQAIPQHYPLLRLAVKLIPFVKVWEVEGHHRLYLKRV